jgi:hypothetical protein
MEFKEFQKVFCDVLPVLYKAAPIVSTLIGTPATSIIVGLLGVLSNVNPCDHGAMANSLKEDPDLFAKLTTLEKTHADWLKNLSN